MQYRPNLHIAAEYYILLLAHKQHCLHKGVCTASWPLNIISIISSQTAQGCAHCRKSIHIKAKHLDRRSILSSEPKLTSHRISSPIIPLIILPTYTYINVNIILSKSYYQYTLLSRLIQPGIPIVPLRMATRMLKNPRDTKKKNMVLRPTKN